MNEKPIVCFINEIDKCFDGYSKEIVKNISDQTYSTLEGNYSIYFDVVPETDKQVLLVHTGVDIMYIESLNYLSSNEPKIELRKNLPKGSYYLDASSRDRFYQGMGWQHHKFMAGSAVLFYAINNEKLCELPLSIIHQLITPAAGINWIEYLLKYGYDSSTVVRFTDCNYYALTCMKHILQWDGQDYPSFIKNLGSDSFNFLDMPWDAGIKNIHNLELDWMNFLNTYPDWLTQWSHIKSSITFQFKHIDFYDVNNNIKDWVDDRPNTFINLSNIFAYFASGPFYSVDARLAAETHIIKQLQQDRPDAFVNFQKRADGGFGAKGVPQGWAKDLNIVLPTDLTKLPWHRD